MDTPRHSPSAGLRWIALLLGALICLAARTQVLPPDALPATAPASQFSAARALEHVTEIAQRPRPIGTAENARVRSYLVEQLARIGAEVEVQTTDSLHILSFGIVGAHPSNVVARIPGTATGPAVMLMAHYDSVPMSPGASDNGAAVAALLEVARLIKAGPPLQNDLILLFTDGEEETLQGAIAFFEEHPLAKRVGAVVNLEARGSSGPSWLFRTSGANGWLIEALAQAGGRPLASSLLADLARILPNITDLQIAMAHGIPGFDFSYLGDFDTYHTPSDSIERLDPRSLQHHGIHATSLVRTLGNLDLNKPPKGEVIYFTLFRWVVSYPVQWALPLSILTLIALGALLILGLRRRHLSGRGLLLALPATLLTLITVAGLSWAALQAVSAIAPVPLINGVNATHDLPLYSGAMVALCFAVTGGLNLLYKRRIPTAELAAGALIWAVVLGFTFSLLLPGGSYLFHWPVLLALVGLALQFGRREGPVRQVLGHLLPLLGILLWFPVLSLLFTALPLAMIMVSTLFLAIFLLLQPLLTGWVAELLGWVLPTAALLAGLLLLSLALIRIDDQVRYNHISYWYETESQSARYLSTDDRLDVWTSQFFPEGATNSTFDEVWHAPGLRDLPVLTGPAPVIALPAPQANLEQDLTRDGIRRVELRLMPTAEAYAFYLYVDHPELLGAEVQGRPVDPKLLTLGSGFLGFRAIPPDGLRLTLQVKAGERLPLLLSEHSLNWPLPSSERPERMEPSPFTYFDRSTFVTKRFEF